MFVSSGLVSICNRLANDRSGFDAQDSHSPSVSSLGYTSSAESCAIAGPLCRDAIARIGEVYPTTATCRTHRDSVNSTGSHASSVSMDQCLANCAADESQLSSMTKPQRMQMLTKRRCLAHAASKLVQSWMSAGPEDLEEGNNVVGGNIVSFHSTQDQVEQSLERYFLRLLACNTLVTPTAFIVMLTYIQAMLSDANTDLEFNVDTVHMICLAALLLATKVLADERSASFVRRFAKIGFCSCSSLAMAERDLLAVLLQCHEAQLQPTASSLLPTLDNLLSHSAPCAHDVSVGRFCWTSLVPAFTTPGLR